MQKTLLIFIVFLSGCSVDGWQVRKAIDVCGGEQFVGKLNFGEVTCSDGTIVAITRPE